MADWGSLPVLPLQCILDNLSIADALSTLSVCKHWRSAILLYEGHKETLKINVKQWDKSAFLIRIFKKYTKNLHIILDGSEQDIEKFMTYLLPQFFDTIKLQEVLFVGPSYLQENRSCIVKIKRLILESLVHKNDTCLQKLALLGCEVDVVNESDRYLNKHIDRYSKSLAFNCESPLAESALPRISARGVQYSMLNHLIIDYTNVSSALCGLVSRLPRLTAVTVCIRGEGGLGDTVDVDWTPLVGRGVCVGVCMINIPYHMFDDVIDTVLVEDLPLVSLKVLFCKTIHSPLVRHIAHIYRSTIQEVVWADCPRDSVCVHDRYTIEESIDYNFESPTCDVNPFILLCWQCPNLRRLAIHGYWVWQYDLLGFLRLRKSLEYLEVSAIYSRNGRFRSKQCDYDIMARVLICDTPRAFDAEYVQEIEQFAELQWQPLSWPPLSPGLQAHAPLSLRAQYAIDEIAAPVPARL